MKKTPLTCRRTSGAGAGEGSFSHVRISTQRVRELRHVILIPLGGRGICCSGQKSKADSSARDRPQNDVRRLGGHRTHLLVALSMCFIRVLCQVRKISEKLL